MELSAVILYLVVLTLALVALVRGADVFVSGARSLGITFRIQPFLVGVLIVGLGTSLPELASSLAALWQGQEEIVLANVVGSNITNILLVGALLPLLAGPLSIRKDLLRSELPLFAIATIHFVLIVYDGVVTRLEGLLLLGTLSAYLWYLVRQNDERVAVSSTDDPAPYRKYDAATMVLGGALVTMIGAHYTVESLATLADILMVPVSVLSIVLIALGTSLPELAVSYQAIRSNQTELAIGNLFGSNAFNILLVAGLPAAMVPLTAAPVVLELGLVVLVAASVMFFVTGLAKQLMPWEGVMLLLFYGFFLVQLTQFV